MKILLTATIEFDAPDGNAAEAVRDWLESHLQSTLKKKFEKIGIQITREVVAHIEEQSK